MMKLFCVTTDAWQDLNTVWNFPTGFVQKLKNCNSIMHPTITVALKKNSWNEGKKNFRQPYHELVVYDKNVFRSCPMQSTTLLTYKACVISIKAFFLFLLKKDFDIFPVLVVIFIYRKKIIKNIFYISLKNLPNLQNNFSYLRFFFFFFFFFFVEFTFYT